MHKQKAPGSEFIGQRIEIPVHYDLWMRGAHFGTVVSAHYDKPTTGQSAYLKVRMDHPQSKRLVRLWRFDWPSASTTTMKATSLRNTSPSQHTNNLLI